MELSRHAKFKTKVAEEIERLTSTKDAGELISRSHEFFTVMDGKKVVAYGGQISNSFVASKVYLWLVPKRKPNGVGKIKEALLLARSYINSLNQTPMCEVVRGDAVGAHFARACGFKEIKQLDDRVVYEWSN